MHHLFFLYYSFVLKELVPSIETSYKMLECAFTYCTWFHLLSKNRSCLEAAPKEIFTSYIHFQCIAAMKIITYNSLSQNTCLKITVGWVGRREPAGTLIKNMIYRIAPRVKPRITFAKIVSTVQQSDISTTISWGQNGKEAFFWETKNLKLKSLT